MVPISILHVCLFILALLTILYGIKIVAQRYMSKHKLKRISERVRKKLFYSHKELIQQMSHQELLVFKQTYENTVQNSITVKINGPTKKRNSKKFKVKFDFEQAKHRKDSIDLSVMEHEQENLIR